MSTQRIEDKYIELVKNMPLRPIVTKEQHKKAVAVLIKLGIKDKFMSRDESDYYQVLSDLIKKYEESQLPLRERSTPQEVLVFLMQEHDCKQADIVPLVGNKSNLSSFLAGRRSLSKASAIRLGERFHIDPRLLLPPLKIVRN